MPEALPWPEGWEEPPTGGLAATGALLVVGLPAFVGGLIGTLADPDGGGPLALAAGIALLAYVPVHAQWFTRGRAPYLRDGALVLPFSRLRAAGVTVALAAVTAGALGPGREEAGYLAWLPLAALLFRLAYQRPWGNALVLSPESVRRQGPGWHVAIPWEHVREVHAHDWMLALPRYVVHQPLLVVDATADAHVERRGLRHSFRFGDLVVRAGAVGVGAVPAYWVVRFYADHPEARGELADERSLDRVERRDLL